MGDDIEAWLASVPGAGSQPFNLRSPRLYGVADLYDRFDPEVPDSWERGYDYRNYIWFIDERTRRPKVLSIADAMAARLHDAMIERAIHDFLRPASGRTVGFMGGHGTSRVEADYERVAGIARELRRAGLMIVTGGGPGLMEAANLGAFLAPFDDDELGRTLAQLREAPVFEGTGSADWLRVAAAARGRLTGDWRAEVPSGGESLGIPTWLYGHEPPNMFCSHIGKYFYNSVREDGLINVASGGIIFAAGEAGTVQEVFQDTTINYYTAGTVRPTPMVFFGTSFWDPDGRGKAGKIGPLSKPVYPLVERLADQAHPPFKSSLLISDDADEIVAFIKAADLTARGDPSAVPSLAELRIQHQP